MLTFFKTREDLPVMNAAPEKIRSTYRKYQWQVFLGLVLGYAMFYVVRMSLNVAKKPMLDAGIVTLEELGVIGSAFFITYAVGKFSNGFLSDYANIGRFMSVALGLSSICTIFMGMSTATLLLIMLWALNGWFQSVGSAPSCVPFSSGLLQNNAARFTQYGAGLAISEKGSPGSLLPVS